MWRLGGPKWVISGNLDQVADVAVMWQDTTGSNGVVMSHMHASRLLIWAKKLQLARSMWDVE